MPTSPCGVVHYVMDDIALYCNATPTCCASTPRYQRVQWSRLSLRRGLTFRKKTKWALLPPTVAGNYAQFEKETSRFGLCLSWEHNCTEQLGWSSWSKKIILIVKCSVYGLLVYLLCHTRGIHQLVVCDENANQDEQKTESEHSSDQNSHLNPRHSRLAFGVISYLNTVPGVGISALAL